MTGLPAAVADHRRRGLLGRYANVLVLEAVLVLLFGLLADRLEWSRREWVFVADVRRHRRLRRTA